MQGRRHLYKRFASLEIAFPKKRTLVFTFYFATLRQKGLFCLLILADRNNIVLQAIHPSCSKLLQELLQYDMKQLYFLSLFLLSAALLPGQTVVFDSDEGNYTAYVADVGLIGDEDYVMDVSAFAPLANSATVSEMTFVGGVTGSNDAAGGVIDFFFFDADDNFVTSAAFNFNEGTFIYTLTLADLELPTEGSLQVFIDDTRAENTGREVIGQWFLSTLPTGPSVGSSPGNPFNNSPGANGEEVAFAMSLTATAATLPVELTSVNVVPNKEALKVTWSTATETNNRGFEVQRSEDGTDFANVGFIEARGRSGYGTDYTFNDEAVLKNTDYYYRLRQIDFDDSEMFSEVVIGALNDNVFAVGEIFPNPATTDATFALHLEEDQATVVTILDATGREVSSQSYDLRAGNHRLSLDVSKLTAGTYVAQVVSAKERVSKRLTVR